MPVDYDPRDYAYSDPYPGTTYSTPPLSGWKCPGCGKCYGPHIAQCFTCGQNAEVTTTWATAPPYGNETNKHA